MDAAYLKAAVPEPFIVLGQKLRPFCLGHEILLQRAKSSLSAFSEVTPSAKHLPFALYICARPYSPNLSPRGFRISWKMRLALALSGKGGDWKAIVRFVDYVRAHLAVPDFYRTDSSSGIFGTPTIQAVKVSLMSNLGMSEAEALNMPYSLAYWNHLAWAEAQGLIQIIDDEELKRQQLATALEKKIEEIGKRIRPC